MMIDFGGDYMNLSKMIDENLIRFDFVADSKEEAIQKVAELLYNANKISNVEKYVEGVFEREEEFSTGIGMGIAIPHCRSSVVDEAAFTLVRLKNEIEWGSLDEKPVNYIIMLAAPNSADNVHLKMLSQLAKDLMDDDFRKGLLEAKSVEDIKKTFELKGE